MTPCRSREKSTRVSTISKFLFLFYFFVIVVTPHKRSLPLLSEHLQVSNSRVPNQRKKESVISTNTILFGVTFTTLVNWPRAPEPCRHPYHFIWNSNGVGNLLVPTALFWFTDTNFLIVVFFNVTESFMISQLGTLYLLHLYDVFLFVGFDVFQSRYLYM